MAESPEENVTKSPKRSSSSTAQKYNWRPNDQKTACCKWHESTADGQMPCT